MSVAHAALGACEQQQGRAAGRRAGGRAAHHGVGQLADHLALARVHVLARLHHLCTARGPKEPRCKSAPCSRALLPPTPLPPPPPPPRPAHPREGPHCSPRGLQSLHGRLHGRRSRHGRHHLRSRGWAGRQCGARPHAGQSHARQRPGTSPCHVECTASAARAGPSRSAACKPAVSSLTSPAAEAATTTSPSRGAHAQKLRPPAQKPARRCSRPLPLSSDPALAANSCATDADAMPGPMGGPPMKARCPSAAAGSGGKNAMHDCSSSDVRAERVWPIGETIPYIGSNKIQVQIQARAARAHPGST